MKRRDKNSPQEQADALLIQWGGNYDLIAFGLMPGTKEEGDDDPPEKVDSHGHSDPTMRTVAKRQHLLQIDAAVRAVIPDRLRLRLYEQYVYRMSQDAAAAQHSMALSTWRGERDDARLIFWNLYHDRRRLVRSPVDPEDARARAEVEAQREEERRRQERQEKA